MITRKSMVIAATAATAILVAACNNSDNGGNAPASTNSMSGPLNTNEVVNNTPPVGMTNALSETNLMSTNVPPPAQK